MELHIIELPKVYREKAEGKEIKLKEWLQFLENPESKEVLNYMESNKNMKEAKEKLDTMSEDDRIRKLAELREKAILDKREIEYTGYCKGKEEGVQEGIKIGKEDGIREGVKNIAKNMKKEGIEVDTIERLTGLSKEEIENLK